MEETVLDMIDLWQTVYPEHKLPRRKARGKKAQYMQKSETKTSVHSEQKLNHQNQEIKQVAILKQEIIQDTNLNIKQLEKQQQPPNEENQKRGKVFFQMKFVNPVTNQYKTVNLKMEDKLINLQKQKQYKIQQDESKMIENITQTSIPLKQEKVDPQSLVHLNSMSNLNTKFINNIYYNSIHNVLSPYLNRNINPSYNLLSSNYIINTQNNINPF